MRVNIIGAGIMGCAAALELARKKIDVRLFERSVPGAEASSAAAGMLAAQGEAETIEQLREYVHARDRYAGWVQELESETGMHVGYRKSGLLQMAQSETEKNAIEQKVVWQQKAGVRAEMLSGDEARSIEPLLTDKLLAAAYFPDDAQVDPPLLLRALATAVAHRVAVKNGTEIESLLMRNGRCIGVRASGESYEADATLLAAGSWSSLIPGLPENLPRVRPARGQLIELEQRPACMRTILFHRSGYIVPRADGRVLCGSTLEFVGFRREVTAGGIEQILAGAIEAVPCIAQASFARAWSQFRPHCEKKIVGFSGFPGLFLSTGHHRNGILLAHESALIVAEAIASSD